MVVQILTGIGYFRVSSSPAKSDQQKKPSIYHGQIDLAPSLAAADDGTACHNQQPTLPINEGIV